MRGVTAYNFSKREYISYWTSKYRYDLEEREIIEKACIDKLESGLISTQKMIELVIESKEIPKEKHTILKCLTELNPNVKTPFKNLNQYSIEALKTRYEIQNG